MASLCAELWSHSTAQADRANRLDTQTLLIDGSGPESNWPAWSGSSPHSSTKAAQCACQLKTQVGANFINTQNIPKRCLFQWPKQWKIIDPQLVGRGLTAPPQEPHSRLGLKLQASFGPSLTWTQQLCPGNDPLRNFSVLAGLPWRKHKSTVAIQKTGIDVWFNVRMYRRWVVHLLLLLHSSEQQGGRGNHLVNTGATNVSNYSPLHWAGTVARYGFIPDSICLHGWHVRP